FLGRLGLGQITEKRRTSEMSEGAANVGLKQHDDRKDEVAEQIANEPVDGLEVRQPRPVEQHADYAAAERHLDRSSAANQLEYFVDQNRHDENVEQIPPVDRGTAQ